MKQTSSIKHRPLRLFFAGDASSGKTTLISVLSTNALDNGYGSARKGLLQHRHEKESGHTSQITSYILSSGDSPTPSGELVHLFDGCGLPVYLKTMIHGFTSTAPDYVFILVDSKTGITQITKEHMGIALALGLPICIVVTKTDSASSEQVKAVLNTIEILITKAANREVIYSNAGIRCEEIADGKAVPVMSVSSVTGEGLDSLHQLISTLSPRIAKSDEKTLIWVRKVYDVPEIGVVLEGLLRSGRIHKGQYLKLGPLDGGFRTVIIKSIVTCKGEVENADYGEDVAIKVVAADGKELEAAKKAKGLVLVTKVENDKQARMFDAEIVVVKQAFIKVKRVVTVHTGNVCQSAEIDDLAGEELLKQGDKGLVRCKFRESVAPYMKAGEKVLFKSGSVVAVGVVTKIYHS